MATKDAAAAKPKRSNPFKQIKTVFTAVRAMDPSITWWLLGVFFGVLALFVIIGFVIDHPIYMAFVGAPFALLATMITLSRRGERAAFG